eukprot:m.175410 g.175410  ORF g.175410 m.175410 type:complete len:155 (+) comp18351_c0_seq6:164-628(+)
MAEGSSTPNSGGEPVLGGWFLKAPEKRGKAQRRYFELFFLPLSAEIRYYSDIEFNQESRVTRGKVQDQKGAIPIYHGSVILFNSEEPILAVCNPTRTWKLTADSIEIAGEWGKTLRKVVADNRAVDAGEEDPGTRYSVLNIPKPKGPAPRAAAS